MGSGASSLKGSSNIDETAPATRRGSRFSRRQEPTEEEMLRYTGKTRAQMKEWAQKTQASGGAYEYQAAMQRQNPFGGPQDGRVAGQIIGVQAAHGALASRYRGTGGFMDDAGF